MYPIKSQSKYLKYSYKRKLITHSLVLIGVNVIVATPFLLDDNIGFATLPFFYIVLFTYAFTGFGSLFLNIKFSIDANLPYKQNQEIIIAAKYYTDVEAYISGKTNIFTYRDYEYLNIKARMLIIHTNAANILIKQAIDDCTEVIYEDLTETNTAIILDKLRISSHNKKHFLTLLIMTAFAIPLFSLFLFCRDSLPFNLLGYLLIVFVVMEVAAFCCREISSEFDTIVAEPLPLNYYKEIRLASMKDYTIYSYLESVRDQKRIFYRADLKRMDLD